MKLIVDSSHIWHLGLQMINTINEIMFQRGIGVFYLDEGANIVEKNTTADDILSSTSRLWCQGRHLFFEDQSVQTKFKDFIFCAKSGAKAAQFYVKKNIDEAPISLSVFQVKDDLKGSNGEKSKWLLLVKDTQKKPIFSAESMAAFYNLTRAEIALVSAIYEGLNLAQHAASRGVKITTVRWTLDNIFSKTYTHSQAELRELANKFID